MNNWKIWRGNTNSNVIFTNDEYYISIHDGTLEGGNWSKDRSGPVLFRHIFSSYNKVWQFLFRTSAGRIFDDLMTEYENKNHE